MADRITDDDLELLGELGVETEPAPNSGRSAREQRIIAGFEEIVRFVEEHHRLPQHGENRDIFERLYAVRLDRMRASPECLVVVKPLDSKGILQTSGDAIVSHLSEEASLYGIKPGNETEPDDTQLLAALGVGEDSSSDLTRLTHVRSREEIRAAEEIAQRNPCQNFDQFQPFFAKVQEELANGIRRTLKYQENAEIKRGDWFILDGQKALVADLGDPFVSDYGRWDRRLRVIYDNGTESDLLMRSLQRALNKDKASRRITEPDLGPLFSDQEDANDCPVGFVYVLRSLSDHPFIAEHRSIIHKIGVTGGDVRKRISNAKKDPTYLLADVEVVATFKLANINRKALEALIHRFFAEAQLAVAFKDRFGANVEPREWFLVPLEAIEAAVNQLMDGSLHRFRYDTTAARIVPL